jgi:hypothetical protein
MVADHAELEQDALWALRSLRKANERAAILDAEAQRQFNKWAAQLAEVEDLRRKVGLQEFWIRKANRKARKRAKGKRS